MAYTVKPYGKSFVVVKPDGLLLNTKPRNSRQPITRKFKTQSDAQSVADALNKTGAH